MNGLKQYLTIAKINLKHNFLPQLLLSAALLCVTPIIFGISNLSTQDAWLPLEMFVPLIGIILLVPIFAPEQSPDIGDVTRARKTPALAVYLIRTAYSMLAVVAGVFIFCLIMMLCKSDISLLHPLSAIANAVFLGALGMLSSAILGSITAAYMVPVIYYSANFSGGKLLGNFYLFSAMTGSTKEKLWLFFGGLAIMALSLIIKHETQKLK